MISGYEASVPEGSYLEAALQQMHRAEAIYAAVGRESAQAAVENVLATRLYVSAHMGAYFVNKQVRISSALESVRDPKTKGSTWISPLGDEILDDEEAIIITAGICPSAHSDGIKPRLTLELERDELPYGNLVIVRLDQINELFVLKEPDTAE